jgi:plasmid stabilization system protein ParE
VPRARLSLPSIIRQDIRDAVAFTMRRYGPVKAKDYAALIREALHAIAANPQSGRRRPDLHPDAWIYPIKKPGRDARHLFLYEIVAGQAQLYGLLYDGMDLPAQWQGRTV